MAPRVRDGESARERPDMLPRLFVYFFGGGSSGCCFGLFVFFFFSPQLAGRVRSRRLPAGRPDLWGRVGQNANQWQEMQGSARAAEGQAYNSAKEPRLPRGRQWPSHATGEGQLRARQERQIKKPRTAAAAAAGAPAAAGQDARPEALSMAG